MFIHSDNSRSGTKYILYPIIFDRVARNDKIIVTRGLVLIIFAPRTVHIIFDSRSAACGSRRGLPKSGDTPKEKYLDLSTYFFPHKPLF